MFTCAPVRTALLADEAFRVPRWWLKFPQGLATNHRSF